MSYQTLVQLMQPLGLPWFLFAFRFGHRVVRIPVGRPQDMTRSGFYRPVENQFKNQITRYIQLESCLSYVFWLYTEAKPTYTPLPYLLVTIFIKCQFLFSYYYFILVIEALTCYHISVNFLIPCTQEYIPHVGKDPK